MASKRELKRQRDQAHADLLKCGADLDTLREWSYEVHAAATPLYEHLREHYLAFTPGAIDVPQVLVIARERLDAWLNGPAIAKDRRVAVFARGTTLHLLIGSTSSRTYCGRDAQAEGIGMLSDYADTFPRCTGCFRA